MSDTCSICGQSGHRRKDCGKPSNAECVALVRALATVLPPTLVPPTFVVREWVGASRVAAEKWAASELQARTKGGTVTEPPMDVRDWIRWGTADERRKLHHVRVCAKLYLSERGGTERRELQHAIAESEKVR